MVKRSQAQWFELFARHEKSGLNSATFCRNEGLCAKYFSLRKKQLNWSGTAAGSADVSSEFVKISVRQNTCGMSLEHGDLKLTWAELPPANWLGDLLKSLWCILAMCQFTCTVSMLTFESRSMAWAWLLMRSWVNPYFQVACLYFVTNGVTSWKCCTGIRPAFVFGTSVWNKTNSNGQRNTKHQWFTGTQNNWTGCCAALMSVK